MYLVKTPTLVKSLFPGLIWSIPTEERCIYLTFDDGPIPEVTPYVLDTLDDYGARATFFCVGENAKRHPNLLDEVVHRGHDIGNHTYNHLQGWGTDLATYVDNTAKCAAYVDSNLFRPPHGRIRPSQFKALNSQYNVIMWDVLSADFDAKLTPQACAANVIESTHPGSIIVFHDSLKAQRNMRYALEATLDHFSRLGYTFETISKGLTAQQPILSEHAVAV